MKKIFTICASLFMTASVFAQSPEKMNYQAVIRNSSDALVTNQPVGMQISILQGSASGTAVYIETQTPTANVNGLVSIEIGAGTVVSGNFSTIDWANDSYFIKTETDPAGGTSYSITGTNQLLSVPYALHAKTAESVSGGITETDPVFTAWDKSTDISITESQVSDLQSYLTTEVDGSVTNEIELPTSGTVGDMAYWNGTAWITVAAGNEGQMLSFVGGVPVWLTVIGVTTVKPTDVYNTETGKVWMGRNLGATQVATSSTDAAAYGDLYQWGRAADGHESRASGTTATLATSDTPGHSNFITINSSPNDWRNPQNSSLWQGVGGTNNPCPSGYRLPTEAEWDAERQSWSSNNAAGAFASPLKLPMGGNRLIASGSFSSVGSGGYYWSSTVDGLHSRTLVFFGTNAVTSVSSRATGISVRCLKD